MAIGFIGSGKLFIPDKTLARNQAPRVRKQQFGDGCWSQALGLLII